MCITDIDDIRSQLLPLLLFLLCYWSWIFINFLGFSAAHPLSVFLLCAIYFAQSHYTIRVNHLHQLRSRYNIIKAKKLWTIGEKRTRIHLEGNYRWILNAIWFFFCRNFLIKNDMTSRSKCSFPISHATGFIDFIFLVTKHTCDLMFSNIRIM